MTNKAANHGIPPGLTLRCTLRGHEDVIHRIAWSPDGRILASPSMDRTIRLWDIETQVLKHILRGHTSWVNSVAWSPDGQMLASGSENGNIRTWSSLNWKQQQELSGHAGRIECLAWSLDNQTLASASGDGTVRIWSIPSGEGIQILEDHRVWVNAVAWSPDGRFLATGAEDDTVRIWDARTREPYQILRGHTFWVTDVAWSPDGQFVASAGDTTVRLWDPRTGRQVRILEGHEDCVNCISFSADGRLLASKSDDNTVRVWRCDRWETVAVVYESTVTGVNPESVLAFHPITPTLATLGENDRVIRIWDLDYESLFKGAAVPSIHYVNAKVILLGESGVGKTGLGIRLAEGRFHPTPGSSHGAQFWQIPVPEGSVMRVAREPNLKAELTLWDLAGQAEYHIVHQLFLDNTDIALLLFDCSDQADPFRGIPYWAKVLEKQAPLNTLKLLVAARCDVCPVTVGQREINRVLGQYELDGYLRTSAKTGEGIDALMQRILQIIPWNELPRTTTPHLFQATREFLLERKEAGDALISMDEVRREARYQHPEREATEAQIGAVIDLLQARGFVYRLDPTPRLSLVLLRPELINQYASSVIQAARNHPRGIGAVPERDAAAANLPLTGFERLEPEEEIVVLQSTVELLIKHDLCFREMGLLVFPSQINITRFVPAEERSRVEVTYQISGSIEAIYASLVVRLSYTDYFHREDQWRYAAEFSHNGHRLGFTMQEVEEGTGELGIYFHPGVSEFDRVTFIRFITDHLQTEGIAIQERIRLYCSQCSKEVENREAVEARVRAGRLDIRCQYCDAAVLIPRSIEERYRSDRAYLEKQRELSKTVEKRTEQEVKEFRADQQQYTSGEDQLIHILHLSDIHLGSNSEARKYRAQLETDLIKELRINQLEYLVISGDVANYSTPDEYKAAFELMNGLVKRFGLDADRVVVVPGNHDLNWDLSSEAYTYIPKHKLPDPLTEEYTSAGQVGALRRNEELYKRRFFNFSDHFYKKVYSSSGYPLDYAQQAIMHEHQDDRLVFLALNSTWEIDHHYRDRANINMDALSCALDQLQGSKYDDWLKIAVWHHPVTGREGMNDEFLQLLAVHGFQICMHGHVHEAKQGLYTHDPARGIHIIGAGTFGAPTREQVSGIPLQYNLLTLDPEKRIITVETRKKEKPDGAWSADARWGDKNNPVPRYTIKLKDWTFSGGGGE